MSKKVTQSLVVEDAPKPHMIERELLAVMSLKERILTEYAEVECELMAKKHEAILAKCLKHIENRRMQGLDQIERITQA